MLLPDFIALITALVNRLPPGGGGASLDSGGSSGDLGFSVPGVNGLPGKDGLTAAPGINGQDGDSGIIMALPPNGVTFGPSAVASITIVNGIVTAAS